MKKMMLIMVLMMVTPLMKSLLTFSLTDVRGTCSGIGSQNCFKIPLNIAVLFNLVDKPEKRIRNDAFTCSTVFYLFFGL
jgi:hypothetical protein